MKKIWVYILGVLTGIVITITVLFIIGISNRQHTPDGLEFFEEVGDVMDCSSYQVFQALEDGYALAWEFDNGYLPNIAGPVVLLYNEDGTPYYDQQIVTASSKECFYQVVIYRYPTKNGIKRTVPIIMLME